jgi:V/A-type H+-transporting ATPase subunit D
MTDLLDVPPTRGQLLELRNALERIREGHDLLDRKREVLLQELLDRIVNAERIQQNAREELAEAQDALIEARIHKGVDRIEWIGLSPGIESEARVRTRSIMGVEVPVVEVDFMERRLSYGPGSTSLAVDNARRHWLDVLHLLGELSQVITTVWRLSQELRKTQRRVNALDEIVIPRYEATIESIEDKLAEEERASIVRDKRVKEMGSP